MERRTSSVERRASNVERRTSNVEGHNETLGSRNLEPGTWNLEPGTWNTGKNIFEQQVFYTPLENLVGWFFTGVVLMLLLELLGGRGAGGNFPIP